VTDKTSAAAIDGGRPAWIVGTGVAVLAILAVTMGFALAPYLFNGSTLLSEITKQVRATTGLVIQTKGHARFDLLPSPHVSIETLHFDDPSGTLSIDADALRGEVRLLPLLVGRLELSSATLVRPRLVIDLDGRPIQPDSTIGRAMHAGDAASNGTSQRLGIVRLADGTAILKGKGFAHAPMFRAIDVTLDWRDLESPATLTGALSIEKTSADIAVWIAQPSSLMRGDHSAVALRLHSAPLDITANGDLASATTTSFHGHVAVNAPSLPAALALLSYDAALPAPFANLALTSDATIGVDRGVTTTVDLPSLHLHVDGNDYEGTLAFQNDGKASLSGTLAAEQLNLTPFFSKTPGFYDTERRWTRTEVPVTAGAPLGLDLRISATHLRLTPFTIDDAALAVMTRNDRTEIALVEGKAYGGAIKGRVSFGVIGHDLTLRGSGSLSDADAATLSWDAFGRQVATGLLAGSANIESTGDSPAALMAHLQGWAKGHANDGELSGMDLGLGLRELARKHGGAVMPALRAGRTPFRSLTFSARLSDGIATIGDATMVGPDSTLSLTGSADIGTRGLDVHAIAATPDTATSGPRARLPIGVTGSFDKIIFAPDFSDTVAPQAP
jgi:AsmA protein